jgi:hypothetical protein
MELAMALTTTQPKAIAPKAFEAELLKMDEGILTKLPAAATITMRGTVMQQKAIDNTLQGWIAVYKAVDAAREALKDALAARDGIAVQARTFYKELGQGLRTYFGSDSSILTAFGISPDHPVSLTTQQKMVAVGKRTKTRKLRGTKGKKQLAAIVVVGNPPVSIASDGTLQVGDTPINDPDASKAPSNTPTSAPTGSGSGGTPGSSTPTGA